ncbi:MAG TPA: formyltransferase family protein [Steroidobacteraceae bacterium]|nr:formyltransferase family protein [Steroidobacteraceae bacterium]
MNGRQPRLRTVFCTRGGVFGALVLRQLLACEQLEVCGIVRSTRTFRASFGFLRGAAALIRRSGLRYALYLFYATTLADSWLWLQGLALRGKRALLHRSITTIPMYATRDLNAPAGLAFLRRCAPDLLVSAFFDQRLEEAALAIPGCSLNIHPALLPQFGGVDPVVQALLRGAPLGVTVHHMTADLDAGAILAQQPLAAGSRDSVFTLTARLFEMGAGLLAAAVARIRARDPGRPQGAGGSYQSWPSPAELRALRARQVRLLHLSDLCQEWR